MSEELLYTQEDIDEWMRACDELQVHLRELEDDIKAKDKQLAIYKRALELACEDISLYEDITTPELKAKCYLDQVKKELEKTI